MSASRIRTYHVVFVAIIAVLVVASPVVGGLALTDDSNRLRAGQGAQQTDAGASVNETGLSGERNLSTADTKYTGVAENDTAGWSVATAGDVNGDGVDDLLIGAPDEGPDNTGAAYIVYGPADPGEVSLSDADVTLNGVTDSERAGYAVSSAGDVNNDSYDDVVIGAPGNDLAAENAGAAYVVLGGESLPAQLNLSDANATLTGAEAGDRAGWSVSNASGLDGPNGVAVGAPFHNDSTGAAYFVSGEALFGTVDLANQSTAIRSGEGPGDQAGWSLDAAGDVNDDGTADVIIGANNWSSAKHTSAGAAYVVTGPLGESASLADAALRVAGTNGADRAGTSVARAGDVNDDGVGDVIVGAPFADPNGTDAAGSAAIIYGAANLSGELSLSEANVTLRGVGEGDNAGASVSAAGSGDVTCDGVGDVLVGAPGDDTNGNDSGAAYAVAGSGQLAGNVSLAMADATFRGEAAGDRAGHSVAEAGDLNNDSSPDIVVGAPQHDPGNSTAAGAAYVLTSDCPPDAPSGEVPDETATPNATETPTATPNATETPTATPNATETPTATPNATETPTATPNATETPTQTPGQTAIGFVAFCFEPGATSTIHITSVDDPDDPRTISYEVESGDVPTAVVHKTGGGPNQLFEQSGDATGTIVASGGEFVGDERAPNRPCAAGSVELKFDDGDIFESNRLSTGTGYGYGNDGAAGDGRPGDSGGDGDGPPANPGPNGGPALPIIGAIGTVGLMAGLLGKRP